MCCISQYRSTSIRLIFNAANLILYISQSGNIPRNIIHHMFRPSIGHLFSLVNLIKQRFSYLAPLNLIRLRYHQQWLLVYSCTTNRCTTNLSTYQSLSWWLIIWHTAAVVQTTHSLNHNISHSYHIEMRYQTYVRLITIVWQTQS